MSVDNELRLLPLELASYQHHPLHATERTWTETNCYVDLWIEVLHALGLEPMAAAAFTLSTDFEGDQWTFFKFPPEDLRAVFGLEVAELNVWRPVLDHVVDQMEMGRLVTMEADSWFLPDTRGVSYQIAHGKSTIVPNSVDRSGRRLAYFHNAGYFELEGDDFDGLFHLRAYAAPTALPPYVETVRLDRMRRGDPDLVTRAVELTKAHLARRPINDPMARFEQRLQHDLEWLGSQDIETFHLYAFGTCRQCGATAELAGSFVEWLAHHDGARSGSGDGDDLTYVAGQFRAVATAAKALQFALARLSRGRTVDLHGTFEEMSRAYELAMAGLEAHYGR
ncbi:MAG TPA: DUF1839 family protein [Acidimicrobiales bacterium]|nr:DUF1839 family protein [Acidimicrobiales bacterium]